MGCLDLRQSRGVKVTIVPQTCLRRQLSQESRAARTVPRAANQALPFLQQPAFHSDDLAGLVVS